MAFLQPPVLGLVCLDPPRQDPAKYINTCYTAGKGASLSPGSNNRLTSFSVNAPFPVWEVILWLRMPEPSGQDRCSMAWFHLPAKHRAKGPQYNIVLQNTRDFNTSSFQSDYHSGEPWRSQNKTSALKVHFLLMWIHIQYWVPGFDLSLNG